VISLSGPLQTALVAIANAPVDLYELYLASGTLYFADQAISWGGHSYLAKVKQRSAIARYDGGQFDTVTVTFSNADLSIAAALLGTDIEGTQLIIRKIDRAVASDSIVLFNGEIDAGITADDEKVEISAKQIIGSTQTECPARMFSVNCPWRFNSYECPASASTFTSCNGSWAACVQRSMQNYFGGFKFIPHSGTFSYAVQSSQRTWYTLFLWARKKWTVKAGSYSACNDTPVDTAIPIVLGRAQLTGVIIQHEDVGFQLHVLAAICTGPIEAMFYIRANGAVVDDSTGYVGTLGQQPDVRFSFAGQSYSLCAYQALTLSSSVDADNSTSDSAPEVTLIVQGLKVDFYNAAGAWASSAWSDNPVWCVRWFMTLSAAQGGMGIPSAMFDDVVNYDTAAYCDGTIQNTTNDQTIYYTSNSVAVSELGTSYRRYRSTCVVGGDPDADGPYTEYIEGTTDDSSISVTAVPVKRFTLCVALTSQESAVDILYKRLLPAFRGYLTFSKTGKIQIRSERPVANTTCSAATAAGVTVVPCAAPAQFSAGDLVLLSPFTTSAEVATVAAIGASSITVSAATAFAHASGAAIYKVAMAFNDSNIVGEVSYPCADRQTSTNRITVKYVDAPTGFEEREVRVNDYEHQGRIHKVNNEDVDGTAIDSFYQAWRIGQWMLAKRRACNKFITAKVDIKATPLEIGDVVVFSVTEAGLQAVPFRLIEMAFEENDEVSLAGQVYSIGVYDDAAPQTTLNVPSIFRKTASDGDVPGTPSFGLDTAGQGEYEIAGVGFESLANTNTIRAGTLTVHYWDELQSPSTLALGAAVSASDQNWTMASACPVAVGDLIQIEYELVRVLEVSANQLTLKVDRAVHGTTAVAHSTATTLYPLGRAVSTFSFTAGFFSSDACGDWSQRISLRCARIAAAEFYVVNSVGSSPTAAQAFTATTSKGLRTLTGGQYTLQFERELTVSASIAPPLVVDAPIAVRDVRAYVAVAPLVSSVTLRISVNGSVYLTLTIPAGATHSSVVDGFGLAPLPEGGVITAAITAVPTAGGSYPGRDLTIVIRT
jgi:hypothetical protein